MTSPRIAPIATLAACLVLSGGVRADIYTWTDPNGNLNVSNVPPPEGVRVTKVIRAGASVPAGRDANADAARIQALSDRVQQLEDALQTAAARPSPPAPPPPVAAPPVVQYVPVPVPAINDVVVREPATTACDPAWAGCGWSWGWPFYPTVVVASAATPRHSRHSDRRYPMPHSIKGNGPAPFGIVRPLVR